MTVTWLCSSLIVLSRRDCCNDCLISLSQPKIDRAVMDEVKILKSMQHVSCTPVSYPGYTQSRTQDILNLVPRIYSVLYPGYTPVSYPGYTQSHTQDILSLIPRVYSVSYPGYTQSHTQDILSLIPRVYSVSYPGYT